jgi:hypothetical protein
MIPYIGPVMARALTTRPRGIEPESEVCTEPPRMPRSSPILSDSQAIQGLRHFNRFSATVSLILRWLQ